MKLSSYQTIEQKSKWVCNQQKLRDWVAAGNLDTQTLSRANAMTAQMNLEGEGILRGSRPLPTFSSLFYSWKID